VGAICDNKKTSYRGLYFYICEVITTMNENI
jgi:hypothetical protein